MRISAKAEYACLAVIELAKSSDPGALRRVREIAEAQAIPERYLVQILLQLKAAGLVHSARGSDGGYHLARRPDEITVADVLSAIDGPGDPPRKPSSTAAQDLGDLLEKARSAQQDVLSGVTIARLAGRFLTHDWVL